MKFALIIPTYNAGGLWAECISSIKSQTSVANKVLVIDSSSSDATVALSLDAGFEVKVINAELFDHGGTRELAAQMCADYEFVIFLTQDALLATDNSLRQILQPFTDDKVGAVCGRQLPRKSATPIEAHARLYNYTTQSRVCSIEDKSKYGLKTAFLSDSFAAYRMSALQKAGGFPDNVIFAEDMYVAAKMLLAGYKIAYAAGACVYHSHDYSLLQEMRRYFDMGVFHSHEPWLRQQLGGAEGEGLRFVRSELSYLFKHAFWQIPESMLRTLFRYAGFRSGLLVKRLPVWLSRALAMNKGYFS